MIQQSQTNRQSAIGNWQLTIGLYATAALLSLIGLTDALYLAGDYTYDAFPATLEGAVRSGVAAARALIGDFTSRGSAAGAAARDSIHAP